MSRRFLIIGLCVVVIISLVALFFRDGRSRGAYSCSDCNVIVIAVDPLRADSLMSMGGIRDNTPVLNALADRGYVFTNTIAASSWTLPSAMSFMTGVYPSVHGIINKDLVGANGMNDTKPASLQETAPRLDSLVNIFRSHGYKTGGFAGGAALNASYGFDKGFDTYVSDGDFMGLASPSAQALDFIKANGNEKVFVFLHGFDVHGQYMPANGFDRRFVSPEYRGKLTGAPLEQKELREEGVRQGSVYITPEDVAFLRAIYDEKVSNMDAEIGKFLDAYEKILPKRKTVIVFTSHHGDEFYEHGRIDHGMTLYDEVIRVPFILSIPGIDKTIRVDQQVRNVDILPTLLEVVGITLPKQSGSINGVSLIAALKGENLQLDAISETSYRYATFQSAIRGFDGWKLVYDREQQIKQLYHYSKDDGEMDNRYGQDEAAESRLISALLSYINGLKSARMDFGGK